MASYHKNAASHQSIKEQAAGGNSKFSSWNTSNQMAKEAPTNYLDNVDELLMYEQD